MGPCGGGSDVGPAGLSDHGLREIQVRAEQERTPKPAPSKIHAGQGDQAAPTNRKHDLEIKIRQIKEFLAEGNKTKVTVNFRGREMANQEMGRTMMNTVMEQLAEAGTIEYSPRMEGRSLIMIVAPKG